MGLGPTQLCLKPGAMPPCSLSPAFLHPELPVKKACKLFAVPDHPLQSRVGLQGRKVPRSWLNGLQIQPSAIRYPSLKKPLSLVAQFLRPGEMLKDGNAQGPMPSPNFTIHILAVREYKDLKDSDMPVD